MLSTRSCMSNGSVQIDVDHKVALESGLPPLARGGRELGMSRDTSTSKAAAHIVHVLRQPEGKLGCRLSSNNTVTEVHAGSVAEAAPASQQPASSQPAASQPESIKLSSFQVMGV